MIAAMGYQITSKVLVGMGRTEVATERLTDEVWAEILQRTDIVRLASERGLDWPEGLALGRRERADIPQPLANTLADALEDIYTFTKTFGSMTRMLGPSTSSRPGVSSTS
jgi:hypothetical protein